MKYDIVVAVLIIVSYSIGLGGAHASVAPNDPIGTETGVGAAS